MRRYVLALGAALALGGGYGLVSGFTAPGASDERKTVVVPHGAGSVVAAVLRDAGVIRYTWPFRVYAGLTAWQGPLRSAEFAFPPHASIETVLAVLRRGRPVQHLLTIPEGLTASRIGRLVAQAYGLVGEISLPAEGSVLPESYAYAFGTSVDTVIRRATLAMRDVLAKAWQERSPEAGLRSADQLLVIASLVERETRLPQERALVARVFLNRLQLGMRLQSDPTAVYAESGGDGQLDGGLSRAALERSSPYNTYVVPGLPAGPICSPGRASIEAVAKPARSSALYFVADGNGGHVFANSLAEHLKNVARYRGLTR